MTYKPTKYLLVRFVLATGSHPMLGICFVVVECKGRAKDLFEAVVSYASMSSFNNSSSLTDILHTCFPTHHTHLATLSLSSSKYDSLLYLALEANRRNPTNLGGREERTPFTTQGKGRS